MQKGLYDIFDFLETYKDAARRQINIIKKRLEALYFYASLAGKIPWWKILTRLKIKLVCRHIDDLEEILSLLESDFSDYYKVQCAFIGRDYPAVAEFLTRVSEHIDFFLSTERDIARAIYLKTKTEPKQIRSMIDRLKKMEQDSQCAF